MNLHLRLGALLGAVMWLVSPGLARAQGTPAAAPAPTPAPSVSASATVGVAVTGDVAVTRGPPWDQWCVAPQCASSAGAGHARDQVLRQLPPFVSPTDVGGYLEARAKKALADAVLSAVKGVAGSWSNEALGNLAVALAAAITHDDDTLAHAKGLGAAIARTGLVYAIDTVLPADAACSEAQRLDAIYEGAAVSASLSPLEFPLKKGAGPSACQATARAAASWIDAAALGGVVPPEIVRAAGVLARKVDETRLVCAVVETPSPDLAPTLRALPKSGEALTVHATATALANAHTSLDAAKHVTEGLEATCARSLESLAALDAGPLAALADQGLAAAPLDALVEAARVVSRYSDVAQLIGRIAADGGLSAQALRDLIRAIATHAGVPTTGVLADAVGVLQSAVVDGPPPTVQPDIVLAYLNDRYDVEDGAALLRSIVAPSPWVFELNGGIPTLSFTSLNTTIVADGTIGYSTKNLGVVASGGINYLDLTNSSGETEVNHPYGSLEAWWVSGGAASKLRFESRFVGGVDYYDSTLIPKNAPQGSANWIDFDSFMIRGTLMAGMRWRPSSRVLLSVMAGGGGQYETQDSSSTGGATQVSLNSQDNVSVQGQARLLFRWRIVPGSDRPAPARRRQLLHHHARRQRHHGRNQWHGDGVGGHHGAGSAARAPRAPVPRRRRHFVRAVRAVAVGRPGLRQRKRCQQRQHLDGAGGGNRDHLADALTAPDGVAAPCGCFGSTTVKVVPSAAVDVTATVP